MAGSKSTQTGIHYTRLQDQAYLRVCLSPLCACAFNLEPHCHGIFTSARALGTRWYLLPVALCWTSESYHHFSIAWQVCHHRTLKTILLRRFMAATSRYRRSLSMDRHHQPRPTRLPTNHQLRLQRTTRWARVLIHGIEHTILKYHDLISLIINWFSFRNGLGSVDLVQSSWSWIRQTMMCAAMDLWLVSLVPAPLSWLIRTKLPSFCDYNLESIELW